MLDKSSKTKALHRIKIIQGHTKAVERMIDGGDYCVDILHQSRAVQTALRKLDLFILENHLKTCVVDQIQNKEEDKTVKELLTLYEVS
ncbi:MAG TPA: metal-sensing transcriptional repressor [Candidatus Saccharimonadales bacterium]|nr:metal-sensing transcriptional repressor [Candidatus Saccharimonadales bacterium]